MYNKYVYLGYCMLYLDCDKRKSPNINI